MSKGIYVDADGQSVRFFGARKLVDPVGMAWHDGLDAAARQLLESLESYEVLRWDGSTVIMRDQIDLAARLRARMIVDDNVYFDRERGKAMFLVLLDEINRLRTLLNEQPRTIQQAKNAYKAKLNR